MVDLQRLNMQSKLLYGNLIYKYSDDNFVLPLSDVTWLRCARLSASTWKMLNKYHDRKVKWISKTISIIELIKKTEEIHVYFLPQPLKKQKQKVINDLAILLRDTLGKQKKAKEHHNLMAYLDKSGLGKYYRYRQIKGRNYQV